MYPFSNGEGTTSEKTPDASQMPWGRDHGQGVTLSQDDPVVCILGLQSH